MSDDKNNSEPFDFDFDSLNADSPAADTGESTFDLDNPFGNDIVVTKGDTGGLAESPGGSSFDLGADLGDSMGVDLAATPSDGELNTDVPEDVSEGGAVPEVQAKPDAKKGFFGRFARKDKQAKKEKPAKEKGAAGEPAGLSVPRDWGTILCLAFSAMLLVSLLLLNLAALLDPNKGTWMQTLCFLGAFNVIGLVAAGVPLLFYKFPKERTLPNVMLGIAAVAVFVGVLFAVTDFYRYGFMLGNA